MNKKNYALGVFDSGLGGLTVVRELKRQLPKEDIVYFGDTARVPYGTKSAQSIVQFSEENVQFLLKHKVKIIVVACNSSSSFAISVLRKKFSLPVVGVIEPGAKKAIEVSKNKKVGVIATSATIQSGKYSKTIKRLSKKMKVVSQACPLLVPLVEEGWFEKKATFDIAKEYLLTIKKSGADVVILGCTHYPILKPVISRVLGRRVNLIDSAKEVACEVKAILKKHNLSQDKKRKGSCKVFVSDKPQHFKKLAKRFLGYNIGHIKKV
ncbi:MAG: glutamate racemase [Candidatus Aceula meridiana]|nr:glutamate racemase [Candidatus Aceula meridiana]